MKIFKLFALLFLSINLFANIALAYKKQYSFKVLMQGDQSTIDKPFVFVARSAETYTQLKQIITDLPDVSTIDFEKNAVVAGFAGTKSTGGYAVEINKSTDTIAVEITKPEKGAMVTQIITAPFKIVIVPIKSDEALLINFSNAFSESIETYQFSNSIFKFSGGFVGISKEFAASGTIKMLSFGKLATLIFDMKENYIPPTTSFKKPKQKRRLMETASGSMINGQLRIARLDVGSFSDSPHPPFSVAGNLKDEKLGLIFSSLPTKIMDGYTGIGSLIADKVK